jgi:chorismate synthase
MSPLSYRTAGESHGPGLLVLIEGLPAGLPFDAAWVDSQLSRRQRGPGRSKRQQIETDRIRLLSGTKGGITIGSPLAMTIPNQDATIEELPNPTVPRPGHADLAGAQKLASRDIRGVLERASARETAARTAAGAVAAHLLRSFGIEVLGFVREIGGVAAPGDPLAADARSRRDASPFYSLDSAADARFAELVEEATQAGDTLGGVVEVIATGVPPGLGHYASSDARLDGRLAAALMSIPAIKAVEIGLGFEAARLRGSEVHDGIAFDRSRPFGGFHRTSNRAGGIEGGMTNGEAVVVRVAMKPIPTLKRGLGSIDLKTLRPAPATYQRSDVCSVPAASVVAESAVAFELARAFLEKFPGDTLDAVRDAFASWRGRVERLGTLENS